jgi:hypothetical protein
MDPPHDEDRDGGIARREFAKAALVIGGSSALSACLDRELPVIGGGEAASSEDDPSPADRHHPQGTDPSTLPRRQHAWNEYLVHDPHGNTVLPQHQLLLFLDYAGAGTPTDEERATVAAAFGTLERAHQRGTGGDLSAVVNEGLLFTVGYSRAYFDRFDDALPEGIGLQRPASVLEAVGESTEKAEDYDALVVMGADYGSILLGAEQALFGELDRLNGVPVEGTLDGVFEHAERRTGFVGKGLPHERIDDDRISESAPQSMGFKSGFKDNQATEERVTIGAGPFAGGTTQLASRLHIDVDAWYDREAPERVHHMFSPEHTPEEVGEVGEELAADSNISDETAAETDDHAERYGVVGHTQKTARARDEEFRARILRRSEGNATDVAADGTVALNFTSVQRRLEAFVETRQAMNGDDLDVDAHHNGIVPFLETASRATFLLPPRRHRALPTPRPR